jgi:predicted nucleotidyltransferase component of viral defense system
MDRVQPLTIEEVKKQVIIAMFSDDDLMERLVLKGGNAIDVVYKIASRASRDIDLSLRDDFKPEELELIRNKIERSLRDTFQAVGYEVFDINFTEKPKRLPNDKLPFWGGYHLKFKIIEAIKYKELMKNTMSLRKQATFVGPNRKQVFRVEISKCEYCEHKKEMDLEGYTIFVYTPAMLVVEKLRAICQQMPEYRKSVKSHPASARARDFFDIYIIIEKFDIKLASEENIELLKRIFAAKNVPLELIGRIGKYREYHRSDFPSVRDTVKPGVTLKNFDFYFEYVVKKCKALEPLWKV